MYIRIESDPILSMHVWPHSEEASVCMNVEAYPLCSTTWISRDEAERVAQALLDAVSEIDARSNFKEAA